MVREKIRHLLPCVLLAAPLLLGMTPPGQLERAVAAQRELVADQPGSAGQLNDLANLLVETGELEEAEALYREAMQIGPEEPEPAFNLALLLTSTDHPREAMHLLKAMLERHPDHAWAQYQLGTLHQARGNRSRALRRYREAFRLDPKLLDPSHNPHVLDNSLATAAMLEAFAQVATATTGQRLYTEPSRITGLLLPPLTAAPAAPMPSVKESPAPAEEEPELVEEQVEAPPEG